MTILVIAIMIMRTILMTTSIAARVFATLHQTLLPVNILIPVIPVINYTAYRPYSQQMHISRLVVDTAIEISQMITVAMKPVQHR